ncbi:MAG: dTMP kinase [Dehalococcoidia bacterium]
MGFFILFEGIEGCGKTTQARMLSRRLSKSAFPATFVQEPGGTATGKAIRRLLKHRVEVRMDPVTELLLFAASRAQLVEEVIRPALKEDYIVVSDRYLQSTVAYQGYGRGLDIRVVETVNEVATRGLSPDLIILLDLDVEKGLQRKGEAIATDRFEREDVAFHSRVRQGYLEMARSEPEKWVIIDADEPKAAIHSMVWSRVQELLLS